MDVLSVDLRDLTDAELAELQADVQVQAGARAVLASSPAQAAEVVESEAERLGRVQEAYHRALALRHGTDPTTPTAWAPPSGLHDAYPLGWAVVHSGQAWASRVRNNNAEPGAPGPAGTAPSPWEPIERQD